MKAFLLAAGLGTRLRPLTDNIPKCLVPLEGKPLLYYWIRLFERYGIDELLINLHYRPEAVREYIEQLNTRLKIKLFYEKELMGSAGTVFANKEWIGNDREFIIAYADNLTCLDVESMLNAHKEHKGVMTIGLFKSAKPEECGIVSIGSDGLITGFYEKIKNPPGDLANAGVYIADRKIFDIIGQEGKMDFGFDVLPKLTGRIYGYKINEYFIDIGTPENYSNACRDWRKVLESYSFLR